MKKLALIIACITGMAVIAQSPVDKIFNKYAGKDGYTTVEINSMMFKLMSNIETNDPEYEDFKKATSGIESIRILAQDNGGANFARELLDILPREKYEEMMVVKESDEEVVFLAREEGGIVTEFLLIVDGKGNDDALIVFKGNIDLESIASLSGAMDLPAMESLEDLE
jgi:hypothetical protein